MNLDGTPSRAVQDPSTSSETCRFRIGASVPISHADRKGPPGITPRAGFIHRKIRASSRLIVAPRRARECGAPVTDTGLVPRREVAAGCNALVKPLVSGLYPLS
jgi:hypothetical protein